MKQLVLSLLLAVPALAFADLATVQPLAVTDASVQGAWITTQPVFTENGMSVFMGMEFMVTTANMSTICRFANGKELEAKVEVPVNVGGGKIEVTGSAQKETVDGGETCNVDIIPGSIDYRVENGVLRATSEGHTLDFVRR